MIQNIFKKTLERKACFSAGIEVNRPLDILPGAEEIRVLLLGDWGSGSIEQKNIAEKSAITCDQLGCDLVLMMGDNFIQHGVENLDDPQFQEKFEKVYTQKVPFYPVLGNHDLQGNWRAQVEYTNHSDRWTMPDSSYDFLGGPVQFHGHQHFLHGLLPLETTEPQNHPVEGGLRPSADSIPGQTPRNELAGKKVSALFLRPALLLWTQSYSGTLQHGKHGPDHFGRRRKPAGK